MALLTVPEFYNTKLYELDDVVYNNIERVFRKFLGDKAREFLLRHMTLTVAQISAQSAVNVMSGIRILSEGGIS